MKRFRSTLKGILGILLLYIFIFSSISLVLAMDKTDIIEMKYTIPDNVLDFTPKKMVDTEKAIQSARKYFKHKNGDKWLKGIWGAESSMAAADEIVIGDDGESFGHFQIQVDCARTVEKKDKLNFNMSDYELRYKLLTDFAFGAEIAARYLGILEREYTNFNWQHTIEGYNRGPGGIKRGKKLGYPYYNNVLRRYKKL